MRVRVLQAALRLPFYTRTSLRKLDRRTQESVPVVSLSRIHETFKSCTVATSNWETTLLNYRCSWNDTYRDIRTLSSSFLRFIHSLNSANHIRLCRCYVVTRIKWNLGKFLGTGSLQASKVGFAPSFWSSVPQRFRGWCFNKSTEKDVCEITEKLAGKALAQVASVLQRYAPNMSTLYPK